MPLIPEGVIDEIQMRADIAEVIGRYMPLKRAGRHFKAHCPFHKEKTPSFMVNTDKQIYHCFGCGAGGNIFSFLMQHDRLTFPEAVRQLGDHVGVRVPERDATASNGAHERLAALMEKTCQYFERTLASPRGKTARSYLQQRGVSEPTRQAFRLGFAPAGWDHLLKAAHLTGIVAEPLEAAGLAIKGKSGHYDRFRNRLIFPILDGRGRVVGFGGRSLDDQEPKYLNSPETALYSKGRQLFGLAQARAAIMERKTAIIAEGYFDCIALAAGGFPHTVSPLGTALTVEQVRLLKRYAERVILAFDPDAAGEAATLRGVELLVEQGFEVRIAQLPQGLDPDEVLQAQGREPFSRLLEESPTIFEALLQIAGRRFLLEQVEGRAQAAQFILATIVKIPNAIVRSEYVRLLAERLHLDEQAVAQELGRAQRSMFASTHGANSMPRTAVKKPEALAAGSSGAERVLAALMLAEPARWTQIQERLPLEDIPDAALREVLRIIGELASYGKAPTTAQVVSRLSAEGQPQLVGELLGLAESIAAKDAALTEVLRRLAEQARKRRLERVRERIRLAQEHGAATEAQELLAEYQQLLAVART